MMLLRRLSYAALVLAFGQIVFGAIVRITGSGMGCGDHWPKCHGYWFPPFDRMDLVIEVLHRYFAATLSAVILALLLVAVRRRQEPEVGGRGGVLRTALLSAGLVVAAALFGAATVRFELANKLVIVIHLAIAMLLLSALIVSAMRAGGLGASTAGAEAASTKTWRAAAAAVVLTFAALVLGAFTAHLPGANSACEGFPLCRGSLLPTGGQHVQFTHRIIAFLLLFHLLGLMLAVRRRGEAPIIVRAARVAFASVLLQLIIAAALVELQLPAVLRSLHQAAGTFVWVAVFTLAVLARRGALGAGVLARPRGPNPTLVAAEVGD